MNTHEEQIENCRIYQERLITAMNEIYLEVVNPTFEEAQDVYTCLELAESCVNMHKNNIKMNCVHDEDFEEDLLNEFENSDYCVMMEELRDEEEKTRCELKYGQIVEMILNMFEDDE